MKTEQFVQYAKADQLKLFFASLTSVITLFLNAACAEDMTITTYYPSPNGTYDALSVKRLSVGDTNADGSINASDVSATSGYLLVADKLGIGTMSPVAKVHILGSSQNTLAVDSSSYPEITHRVSGTIKSYNAIATSAGGYFVGSAVNDWIFRNEGGASIKFGRGTTTDVTFDSSGNVGIGTISPADKLEVNGNLRVDGVVTCLQGICSPNNVIRLTPNLHLNSAAGYATIVNWDNGTTGSNMTFRVGNGASADIFYVLANGTVRASGELTSTMASGYGQSRYVAGNYGIINRNDGSDYYILLTNAGDQYGIWSGLRPFRINNGSGYVYISDLTVNDGMFRSGTRSNFLLALQGDRNMVLYDNGGAVWASGTSTSDIRLKKNVKDIGKVIDKLEKIRAINFNFKDDESNKREIGVIAQELEKDFPELIYTDQKSGYKLVDYPKLTVLLLQAVKDLRAEEREDTLALSEEIKGMKREIAELKKNSR